MLAALEARIRSEEVAEDASVKGSAAVSRLREIGSNEARFAANILAERVVATAITRAEQTAVAARLAAQTVREEAARMVALTDARADAAELNVRQALDAVRALIWSGVLSRGKGEPPPRVSSAATRASSLRCRGERVVGDARSD